MSIGVQRRPAAWPPGTSRKEELTARGFASRQTAQGLVIGAIAIAGVSAVIALLDNFVALLGLSGLYFFAILPVAIGWGFWVAAIVAVASYMTFDFFLTPPLYTFAIGKSETETAIVTAFLVSLGTAYLVDVLARRAQARADEQTSLRRVATLVAQGVPPEKVFAAVTEEVGRLLGVDRAAMGRYKSDGTVTETMIWTASGEFQAGGERLQLGGRNAATLVFETRRPVRIDSYADARGTGAADHPRERGFGSSVAAPINVEGRLWGFMIASTKAEHSLPADAGERLAQFTELVATAIANAEARAELTASRARIVAAADEVRRSLERDLHDAVQQRLVSVALRLRGAQEQVPDSLPGLQASLAHAVEGLKEILREVQDIARGLHPSVLSKGGLVPALKALARRSAIPVEMSLDVEGRLPEQAEVATYHVVAEAIANVIKHSQATMAIVSVRTDGDTLHIEVRDDGAGGADPRPGSGLIRLIDRVEALGGAIEIASPTGQGTSLSVTLPLDRAGTGREPPKPLGSET